MFIIIEAQMNLSPKGPKLEKKSLKEEKPVKQVLLREAEQDSVQVERAQKPQT